MLADGINFPLVMAYGIAVLIPLLLFQVVVEGAILAKTWGIPFRDLSGPVLRANCWSLLSGIPVKFANSLFYPLLLHDDLRGYFELYPLAISIGTAFFFVVTLVVEKGSLQNWLMREDIAAIPRRVWLGVLVANLATYAVLAPIHYHATKPRHDVREFTRDTSWAKSPPSRVTYIDSRDANLKVIDSNGANRRTLVPTAVKAYTVNAGLDLVVFEDKTGKHWIRRVDTGETTQTNTAATNVFTGLKVFGSTGNRDWGGRDTSGDWVAWAPPGLGNSIRVYKENSEPSSHLFFAVNPGLLHLAEFRYFLSRPTLISGSSECLFQSRDTVYLLDVAQRRVGKLTNGRNYAVIPP
ncbi:MAG: hypothetical protein FJ386_01295 [Verrucomicrobia bacterium]|nr:hypothetical protein [Verrucomicrobiota bacterium]